MWDPFVSQFKGSTFLASSHHGLKPTKPTALIDGCREEVIRNGPPPHCGPHTALTHPMVGRNSG